MAGQGEEGDAWAAASSLLYFAFLFCLEGGPIRPSPGMLSEEEGVGADWRGHRPTLATRTRRLPAVTALGFLSAPAPWVAFLSGCLYQLFFWGGGPAGSQDRGRRQGPEACRQLGRSYIQV